MKSLCKYANIFIVIFMALFMVQGTELEGKVRLVGTSLFPSFVLTTDEGDYHFSEDLVEEFSEYQHKTIKIRATDIEEREVYLGNGSTYIHYTILEAEILEVK